MNKTLLASAILLALTSTAHSAVSGRYLYGEGQSLTVNEAQATGVDRVLGGSTTSADFKTGSVTVNTGNWNMIVGGSYLSETTGDLTIGFESTSVTINSSKDNTVTAKHVVGGTAGSNAQRVVSNADTTRTAKLTINGGSFGNAGDWTNATGTINTLESLIIGGDHFKNNPSADEHKDNSTDVHLKSTDTVIRDATVNSLVIGGSLANQYYAAIGSGVLKTHVGTANTVIIDSTLHNPVVAGGVACGINAVSSVDQANLEIHDSTVNSTVYTGGVVKYGDTSSGEVSADVGKSTLVITNSTVKAIENGRGYAEWTSDGWIFKREDGLALDSEEHDAVTDLTLVNSTVENVNLSKGSVTLGVEENGIMTINTLTLGDAVTRRATADGVTNDAVGGDVNAFLENHIKIGNGSTVEQLGDATVELAEGEAVGKVTGEIVDGKLDESTVVEDVNQKSIDVTNLLGMMPRFVTRVEMNDLRKRMGDLRAVEGKNGVWARYDGGKLSGQGLDHKFNKIQVGADTMPSDNGIRYGFALSYTQGDVDGSASTADTDTYSLAGYGVWLGDEGQFADVIARVAKVGTDLTTAAYSADLDQLALSLSGEFGWRFDLAKSLYVEPSIEATYTYIEDETFTGTTALFEIDSTNSFMTRAGAALGWKLPDDRGDIYVRGGLVHEFLGDSKLSVNHGFRTVELDGQDTWFEYAIGGNYKVGNNAYVYADVERSAGGDIDVDWRANIGARFVF